MTSAQDPGRSSGRRRAAALVLAAALAGSIAAVLMVALRGPQPARTLDERAHAVAETLRCPVCQDLSVADSSAPLAREMRRTIEAELRAGRTPDQVRDRFVAAYGEWILLSPPRRGPNVLLWVAPALLLVGGLVVGAVAVRRWTWGGSAATRERATSPGSPVSEEDRRLLEEALAGTPEETD